jgi:hypothetical protein
VYKERRNVECNGQRLPINDNLFYALQRVRLSSKPRPLWVDDICVNQDDLEERSEQVKIFDKVYAGARTVLIWLGRKFEECEVTRNSDEATDGEAAMDFFQRMVQYLSTKHSKQEIIDPDLPSLYNAAYRTPKMIAMHDLFSRPWFSRVWTLQEATFAESALVLCGEKEVPFSVFEKFDSKCQEDQTGVWTDTLSSIANARPVKAGENPRFSTAHIHAISRLKNVRSGTSSSETAPALLNMLRSCDAKDARDRIYSIWSFLPPKYVEVLEKPHYEKEFTAADLFYQVSQIELVNYRNLDILGMAGLWQKKPDMVLPSWVADWTYRPLTHPLWVLDQDCLRKTGTKLYQAASDSNGTVSISEASRRLTIKGKLLGVVKELSDQLIFTTDLPGDETPERPTEAINANTGADAAERELAAKIAEYNKKFKQLSVLFYNRTSHIDSCFALAAQCDPYPQGLATKTACLHTLTASLKTRGLGSVLGDTVVRANSEELKVLFSTLEPTKKAIESGNMFGVDMRVLKLFGCIQEAARYKKFFVTADRYIGLAPAVASEGDRVVVVYGCSTPFLLRAVEGSEDWQLVGECYVYGLMDGEAMRMDDIPTSEFGLV